MLTVPVEALNSRFLGRHYWIDSSLAFLVAVALIAFLPPQLVDALAQPSSLSQPYQHRRQAEEEYASFARELADAAAAAILPYWRQPSSFTVESKQEEGRSPAQTASPVTAADRAGEFAMRELIEERYPTHGICGEEFGEVRVEGAEYVWVLDPIDGTKSFVTGKPTWGTLIGCLRRGVPVVGVIDHSVLKERWVGFKGGQTTLNGQPIHVDPSVTKLADATLYTTTPDMFRVGEELEKFESVRDKSLRTLYGCDCYAYALVASGFGADAVVEADLGLYDYCAVVPVVEGAGGVMSDWRGEPLTLQNHDAGKGRVVACSNAALHSEILDVLNKARWRQKIGKGAVRQALALLFGIALGAILEHNLQS
jgi:inositol-phosphate phosphatase/L-galactose 1-phosphate phosphatase/histidinol-phosphatase